jgi:acyl carrier protein
MESLLGTFLAAGAAGGIAYLILHGIRALSGDKSGSHDPNGLNSTDQDGRNCGSDTTYSWREESKGSIEVRVKEIIAIKLGVEAEKVTPEASFEEDLGASFTGVRELVTAFEREFSIDIPDEDGKEMATVGEAIRYLQSNLAAEALQADDLVQKMSDSAPYSPDQSQSSVLSCLECGHENPAEVNFCTKCRAKMTLECNKCGFN